MLLYADEDFPLPVVDELRRLGHDVFTAQEDGRTATPDPDVLARAHSLGRSILTHNRRHYLPQRSTPKKTHFPEWNHITH
jgi:Domain of unknown function (DUF5615)